MEDILKLSLLAHIERIVELSEKSKLSDKFYEKANVHIEAVCKALHLNSIQAILFSHLVDNSSDRFIYMSTIAEKLKIRAVRLIQYQDDIDELEKWRLVRCRRSSDSKSYHLPAEVLEALRKEQDVKPADRKNLSIDAFFDALNQLFEQRCDDEMTQDFFVEEIDNLLNDNEHLLFVKKVKNQFHRESENLHLILRFCNIYVEDADDYITSDQLEDCFENSYFRRLKRELSNKTNALIENGWVECANDEGFETRDAFKLPAKQDEICFW